MRDSNRNEAKLYIELAGGVVANKERGGNHGLFRAGPRLAATESPVDHGQVLRVAFTHYARSSVAWHSCHGSSGIQSQQEAEMELVVTALFRCILKFLHINLYLPWLLHTHNLYTQYLRHKVTNYSLVKFNSHRNKRSNFTTGPHKAHRSVRLTRGSLYYAVAYLTKLSGVSCRSGGVLWPGFRSSTSTIARCPVVRHKPSQCRCHDLKVAGPRQGNSPAT